MPVAVWQATPRPSFRPRSVSTSVCVEMFLFPFFCSIFTSYRIAAAKLHLYYEIHTFNHVFCSYLTQISALDFSQFGIRFINLQISRPPLHHPLRPCLLVCSSLVCCKLVPRLLVCCKPVCPAKCVNGKNGGRTHGSAPTLSASSLVCCKLVPRLLVCLSACLLVCLSACLLVCLSACLLVCLFACLLVCLSACLLVCLFACLLVCSSACLLVCLFAVNSSAGINVSSV